MADASASYALDANNISAEGDRLLSWMWVVSLMPTAISRVPAGYTAYAGSDNGKDHDACHLLCPNLGGLLAKKPSVLGFLACFHDT